MIRRSGFSAWTQAGVADLVKIIELHEHLKLQIDSVAQSLAVDGAKARELSKIGQELLQDHNFALDCVQPKCSELKIMCQKLEHLLTEKRRMLHKFLDLFDGVQSINKWCDTSMDHLSR